jgi:hypothetical protein
MARAFGTLGLPAAASFLPGRGCSLAVGLRPPAAITTDATIAAMTTTTPAPPTTMNRLRSGRAAGSSST